MKWKALVVGAGIGGLTAAMRLVKSGYEVEIVEKFHQAGGRVNLLQEDGFTFDSGATMMGMSYELKEFERDCQIQLPFKMVELNPLFDVIFEGSPKPYRISKNLTRLGKEFDDLEKNFPDKAKKFLHASGRLFHDSFPLLFKKNISNFFEHFISIAQLPYKHFPRFFRPYWQELGKYFQSDKVKQILSLPALFNGSTPFEISSFFSFLSYNQMKFDGNYSIEGGVYQLVQSLIDELVKNNVKIHYNTEIIDFVSENNKIKHLIDKNSRKWHADLFLINADACVFRNKVLKHPAYDATALDKMNWSMAPFSIYLGLSCKLPQLSQNTCVINPSFKEYAGKNLKHLLALDKPYYYVNIPSKANPHLAPLGCEAVMIQCLVPNLKYKKSWVDKKSVAENIIQDLSYKISLDLESFVLYEKIQTPEDWEQNFGLWRGSGFGPSLKLNQIGGFRTKNYDEKFQNLFYCGASTIPGNGIPMVIISSKLACERIWKKFGAYS